MAIQGLIIPVSYNDYISKSDPATLLQALRQNNVMDSTPTENSVHPITSGGVKTAVDALSAAITALDAAKQALLTFDNAPAAGSSNPVTSDGIKTAIDDAVGTLGNTVNEALQQKVSGYVEVFNSTLFPDYASWDGMRAMINSSNIKGRTSIFLLIPLSVATTLNAQGVLPVNTGGVLHIVKTTGGGRAYAEFYSDSGYHYHGESSNINSAEVTWYVDTMTAV